MPDTIDPSLAALLGGGNEDSRPLDGALPPAAPDFQALFGRRGEPEEPQDRGEFGVDLTRKNMTEPGRYEAESPGDYFSNPEYYKQALGGEGDEAQKLHDVLSKYLKAQDPKDRGVFRQQLVPAFWYLAARVALHTTSSSAPLPKRLLLRFGALLPSLLTPELRDTIQRVIFEKEIDEPVYYVDEWIAAVANGQVKASATDEVKVQQRSGDDRAKVDAALQKAQGKRDAAGGVMKAKAEERRSLEALLRGRVEEISRHVELESVQNLPSPYTEAQKKGATEIMEILRRMIAADKALAQSMEEYRGASDELAEMRQKARGANGGSAKADLQSVAQEFETVRQMTKLCIGRQGNHFPLLSREYFRGSIRDMGTRENVVKTLGWIESIDSEAYCRPYKNTLNRIVPFVVILPCYGDFGICWEPFDRYNRASSRGRLAIPLYPKNLQAALIYAVADLRWQVAKEKASYYWMEEGLTGNYYQWFTSKKMKGDVKEFFIQDYIVWITKESEGIQKLEKEVRAIFWRYLPFSQAIKEKLKTRSYIYQELYQKDVNRSLSDGY